jgi:hypothetical protein
MADNILQTIQGRTTTVTYTLAYVTPPTAPTGAIATAVTRTRQLVTSVAIREFLIPKSPRPRPSQTLTSRALGLVARVLHSFLYLWRLTSLGWAVFDHLTSLVAAILTFVLRAVGQGINFCLGY